MRIRFLPREHGAYAQLGVPLVVALAAGRPGLAAAAFALAAIALFFVHEPVLSLAAELGG
ncbi:MAG: YwiC-like family protein, partial [Deltaproteobacteria bacterium]|nr:YwiC-like family protein [Kofleriaceae bacterium]